MKAEVCNYENCALVVLCPESISESSDLLKLKLNALNKPMALRLVATKDKIELHFDIPTKTRELTQLQ